jgi:DNA-directed RNA polymerase specialized sigma24 family protein
MSKPPFELRDDDKAALDALPDDQRLALLSYQLGNSYAVIADISMVAVGTVKSRINRARTKILTARAAAAGAPQPAEAAS